MVDHDENRLPDRGSTRSATDTPDLVVGALDNRLEEQELQSRRRIITENILPPVVAVILVIGLWYFVAYVILEGPRRFLLEPPHAVIEVAFLDGENLSELLRALWSSTKVAAYGLLIAVVLGVATAVVMSQAKVLERAIFPLMVTVQAVPVLALVPIISFWRGNGIQSRVIVCVIIAVFPIIVNTLFGLQSADRAMHDMFTLHDASRFRRLRKLMFPAGLPAMFTGLRISAGLSVVGAIVGDFFFGKGEAGIGNRIVGYSNRLEGEMLLAAVILSSALGVAAFLLFGWLQNVFTAKWHEAGAQ